jgi:hypothetical protein
MDVARKLRGILAVGLLATITSITTAQYSGGSGTADAPYQIATAEDLMLLSETPEDYDKHFILTADIDLDPNLLGRKVFDGAVIAPDAELATSAYDGPSFTGVLDGRNHTISNLTIVGKQYLGLFGRTGSGAEIRRVGLAAVQVYGTGFYVGGLVGRNQYGSIHASYSDGSVSADSNVGGLVGCNEYGSISSSHSSGSISGTGWGVGGLVGCNYAGSVVMSYSTGSISGSGSGAGGLVGDNDEEASIATSCAGGAVSGRYYVGGLSGDNEGRISTSYSSGSAAAEYRYVGGLVGETAGSVTMSYSSAAVSGVSDIGGLVGILDFGGVVNQSFWDTETSGQAESDGGAGMSTAEMQAVVVFLEAGWEFVGESANGTEAIWTIVDGEDYPRLTWEYRASNPYPADGALNVPQPLTLSWGAARRSSAYDIYVSQDEIAIMNATPISEGIYRGRQPAGTTAYDPGVLESGKTYYWRIDALNQVDPCDPWIGDIWTFTTADFLAEDPVFFADADLQMAIECELWLSDPTPTDMLGLTCLSCNGWGGQNGVITDLTGLEYAVNLQSLSLTWHGFSFLAPLSGLTNLEELDLRECPVTDVSPLAALHRLSWLNLHKTQVSSIAPLIGLTSLSYVDLRSTPLDLDAYEIYIPQLRMENPDITILCDPYRPQSHVVTISRTGG